MALPPSIYSCHHPRTLVDKFGGHLGVHILDPLVHLELVAWRDAFPGRFLLAAGGSLLENRLAPRAGTPNVFAHAGRPVASNPHLVLGRLLELVRVLTLDTLHLAVGQLLGVA